MAVKDKDLSWLIVFGGLLFTATGLNLPFIILNPLHYSIIFIISVLIWLPTGTTPLIIGFLISPKQFRNNRNKFKVCIWVIILCGAFSLIWEVSVAAPWILIMDAATFALEAAIASGILTFGGAPLLIIGGFLSWKYLNTSKG